jgi:hypothetical protein
VEDFEVGWKGNESNAVAFGGTGATAALSLNSIFDSGDYTNDENYATAVAVSGNYAAIGCPGYTSIGANVYGAVFLLLRDSSSGIWQRWGVVQASDKADGDEFGRSLALENGWLLIGAPGDDSDKGAIYAFKFENNSFVQKQKFAGSTTAAGDRFGDSVAISGAKCIVGAPQDDDQDTNDGSAWLFDRSGDTWSEDEKILPTTFETNGYFGTKVALDAANGIAAVSGRGYNNGYGNDEGYVVIFEDVAGTYTEVATFVPDSAHRNENNKLGESLVILDGTVAAGAGGETIDHTLGSYKLNGAVYIITKDPTWAVKQRIEIPELHYRGSNMEFGGGYEGDQAIALTENFLLVGCRGLTHFEHPRLPTATQPDRDLDMGGAFLYEFDSSLGSYVLQTRVYPAVNGRSGAAVALDETAGIALLGAYWEARGGGTKTGAVRIYDLAGGEVTVDQETALFDTSNTVESFEYNWKLPHAGTDIPFNHMSLSELSKDQQIHALFDSGANKAEDFEASDWNNDDATAYDDAPTPGTAVGTAAMFDSGTQAVEDFEDNWNQSNQSTAVFTYLTFDGANNFEDFETGTWTDTLDW